MNTRRVWMTAAILVSAGLALGACRESEQNRPLMYEKGVYLGPADDKVSEQALENARSRGWTQRGF